MVRVEQGALRFFQCGTFDTSDLAHAIFSRHGGGSPEPYASLNMSVSTGDAKDNVRQNMARAFGALELDPASRADLWQGHSGKGGGGEQPHAANDHPRPAGAL